MRILVTGAANPFGAAVAHALAEAGHTVRAFAIPVGEDPFHDARIACFPGTLATGGSVEPVAAQCQAIVHCAALDAPGKDKAAHVRHLEMGTMYARYGAERELVAQFIALFPKDAPRAWAQSLKQAEAKVAATRSLVPHAILRVATPEDAAKQVIAQLGKVRPVVA